MTPNRIYAIVSNFQCLRFAAPAPRCPGQKPVCRTCLYASSEDDCRDEGYDEDGSDMTDVSRPVRRQTSSPVLLFFVWQH